MDLVGWGITSEVRPEKLSCHAIDSLLFTIDIYLSIYYIICVEYCSSNWEHGRELRESATKGHLVVIALYLYIYINIYIYIYVGCIPNDLRPVRQVDI